MWMVLMRTGPFCPHADSKLFLSALSAGKMFIDALAVFPTSTVWLGCPISSAWGN
jgi:hypothetical protein